jgi:hypothetical protein
MDPAGAALRELLEKQAIVEVLYRYARACDRADESMLRSVFHPDATTRHGRFDGTAADFCTLAMKIVHANRREKHLISNVMIELDGDRAIAESHYVAYHRRVDRSTGAEEDFLSGGRFIDRFERRDGSWRVAARVGLVDFERFDPVTERTFSTLTSEQTGRHAPLDPLYVLMPSLRAAV